MPVISPPDKGGMSHSEPGRGKGPAPRQSDARGLEKREIPSSLGEPALGHTHTGWDTHPSMTLGWDTPSTALGTLPPCKQPKNPKCQPRWGTALLGDAPVRPSGEVHGRPRSSGSAAATGDPGPGGQLPNLTGACPPPPPARDYHKLRRNYSMEIYSTKLRR